MKDQKLSKVEKGLFEEMARKWYTYKSGRTPFEYMLAFSNFSIKEQKGFIEKYRQAIIKDQSVQDRVQARMIEVRAELDMCIANT